MVVIRESSIYNLFSKYESILVIINKQSKPFSLLIVFQQNCGLRKMTHNEAQIINPHRKFCRISAFQCPPIGRLHMMSHILRQKKWLTKTFNLCWKGIGQTPTFGVILKTNEKLIKNWNKL